MNYLPLRSGLCALGLLVSMSLTVDAVQDYEPPPSQKLDEKAQKAIAERMEKLGQMVQSLRRQGMRDPYLADVEVYYKAAVWIQRFGEYYQPKSGAWTQEVLDRGLLRGALLSQGDAPWLRHFGQTVVRGYRSRVDDSVQPYAVTYPADYGTNPNKKYRLDVVLHGRDKTLTEVKFIQAHSDRAASKDISCVILEIYGRGNNAYRWAGETDVIEVVENFAATETALGRPNLIDPARIVLRGFSMGGAGTWHLGLHSPSRWCVIGPGAGFTTTHGYIKKLPAKLPPEQEACLHIYDAVDYAENAFNVPVVSYAGEKDAQLQAARNIQEQLAPLKIPMQLLVAPGLEHQFPPEWQKKAEEAYAPFVFKGKSDYPSRVRFVTYTLRYPSCHWVELLALEEHYQRAFVDAEQVESGFKVKTANVRQLHLALPNDAANPWTLEIDGQTSTPMPWLHRDGSQHLYLEKTAKGWMSVVPAKIQTDRVRRPQKAVRLQGPIDDAFMERFICVRGTGTPWNEEANKLALDRLQQFQETWAKYMRGSLIVKDDHAVSEDDFANSNLILFGDPGSNSLIAQAIGALPLTWTKEKVELGGKSFTAAQHMPAMIYPSPFNAGHYVVLNSGHTFDASDFAGTNALLYPRLGDYAVLKAKPASNDFVAAESVLAGLFDEFWRIPVKK